MKQRLRSSDVYYLADRLREIISREDIFASCLTCTHERTLITEQGTFYRCVKYNSNPPLHILVNGCEGYEDNDEIPF